MQPFKRYGRQTDVNVNTWRVLLKMKSQIDVEFDIFVDVRWTIKQRYLVLLLDYLAQYKNVDLKLFRRQNNVEITSFVVTDWVDQTRSSTYTDTDTVFFILL